MNRDEFIAKVMLDTLTREVNIRPIVYDWILLTYDLPVAERKTRYNFLKEARLIGAVRHTQSVYLMPYTETAMSLAEEVAGRGKAYVWVSQVDEAKASLLTAIYDRGMEGKFSEIERRLKRIAQHITNHRRGVARRMIATTGQRLRLLEATLKRRGSPLLPKVMDLWAEMGRLEKEVT